MERDQQWKGLLAVLATVVLIISGLFAAFVSAFTQHVKFYVPLTAVVVVGLIVFVNLSLVTRVNKRKLAYSLLGFILVVGAAFGGYKWNRHYHDSFATIQEQGVKLYEYQPFRPGTKAVALDKPASLKLSEQLPRLDGATALYPLYAAFVQAVYPEGNYEPYKGIVQCTTTPDAYRALIEGETDIIFVAAPSDEQLAFARSKGVELELTPIGKEAFVFFVSERNPVAGLSVQEIRDIYAGRTTNWRELGGSNSEIRAFQRPAGSGSQSRLEALMKGDTLAAPPREDVVSGMGGIISQTADYRNYPNAIGYSFLFFATEMVDSGEVRLLSIDGVQPSRAAVASGTYPFSSEFYAVTAGKRSEQTTALIDWILSEEGQQLVARTGYTPLSAR